MTPRWYIGKYQGTHGLFEVCWGFIRTGYWYAGGYEGEPHRHKFWGLVWAGKWTFGVGYEVPDLSGEFK